MDVKGPGEASPQTRSEVSLLTLASHSVAVHLRFLDKPLQRLR